MNEITKVPGSPAGQPVTLTEVERLLQRPLLELVFQAAQVHREHHDPERIQCSRLLSIKTGGCPEDCSYCSQSSRYKTDLARESLLDLDYVLDKAREALAHGADRFCMGAAWRGVRDGEEFDQVLEMVRGVKALGLETCVTLGFLSADQAGRLREAGLDFYNHNLDTGRSHYDEIVRTHTLDDRLRTLHAVGVAGIQVCTGGILGMGEDSRARAELLHQLACLEPAPRSVPINALVRIDGTPLAESMAGSSPVDWSEMVRMVAAARILMPATDIRLSAGRSAMTEEGQTLCFLAGANSIFIGDELLTTPNPDPGSDAALLRKVGLRTNREPS